jgi:hypothetical protein
LDAEDSELIVLRGGERVLGQCALGEDRGGGFRGELRLRDRAQRLVRPIAPASRRWR